jgi:hypothetical protein
MKEFVQTAGVRFDSVNVLEEPERGARLLDIGGRIPAAVIGERWAPGADLRAVAQLLGIPYKGVEPLPPKELSFRYHLIMATLCGFFQQASPAALGARHPMRKRTVLDIGYHAASVMRLFLAYYDNEQYEVEEYVLDADASAPSEVRSGRDVADRAIGTLTEFDRWWSTDGYHDPLDRVVETYWGHHSLHAALEREVWHTAQHTRQVEALLREAQVTLRAPLAPLILDGLPLPTLLFA